MHSTLKLRESDPHDDFSIAPEVVRAAWADKVLADITGDARSSAKSSAQPDTESGAAGPAAPMVDTTFRPTAADDIRVRVDRPPAGKLTKSAVMLVFAVCCAAAATALQQHGEAAKQMISRWVPAFALTSSPPAEKTGLAGQPDTSAVQASAADQAQPAPPAQPAESAAPAAAAPASDTAQLQSMARDLAAMGQQVEQLKASIAELKAGQQAMAGDVAKPSEVMTSVQTARPKTSAPPRSAAVPARKPMPAYSPVQAAAPALLPQAALPPQPALPAATRLDDGEPVLRPPMPLR